LSGPPFRAVIGKPSPQIKDYGMSAHGRSAAGIERSMHGVIAKSMIDMSDFDAYTLLSCVLHEAVAVL
jgi:hypothetical protein